MVELLFTLQMQATGAEYLNPLIGITDTGMHLPEMLPTASDVTRFLKQFSLCRIDDSLTRINLAGR